MPSIPEDAAHDTMRQSVDVSGGVVNREACYDSYFGPRPVISSLRGVVSSAHPLASQAGLRILSDGGNAFDAVIATASTLNVVEPYMSGIGGMGVATFYVAGERRIRTLDFIPAVPREYDASTKSREDLRRGPHSAGTPGNLAGWCELLAAYGHRSRAEVFAPAIDLARNGFPITDLNSHVIGESMVDCASDPNWATIYTDAGAIPEPGWVLRQTDLANTLEAVAADGADYLYRGKLGQSLVTHLRALGGSVSSCDLDEVHPRWDDPIAIDYGAYRVHTPPPQSEGFQMLLGLQMLRDFNLADKPRNGVEHLDWVFRAIRLAAEQRILNANASRDQIAAMFSDAASGRLSGRLRSTEPICARTELFGEPEPSNGSRGGQHTTSMSVGDGDGNVVCITQSLGSPFGSGIAIPGTGIVLNNFLNWGELHPDSANYMTAGAPLSLPIAPSVTTSGGEPVLALGTPGGFGICQTQTQVFVQWAEYGLSVQKAIEEPRAILSDGTSVQLEARISADTVRALRAKGHDVIMLPAFDMHVGGMQGVMRDPETGALFGGADPRRDGYAVGL